MSLRAPIAIVVEIRADQRRWFRLSRNVGSDGLGLCRPVPVEVGRTVEVRFVLPLATAPASASADPDGPLSLRAEVGLDDGDDVGSGDAGGNQLTFVEPPHDARQLLRLYVKERLGLHLR
jgi:hypothetical protein